MATGATGYGLLSSGFYPKPLSVIEDEVDAGLQAILGESAGTGDGGKLPTEGFAGQLKALWVDREAGFWDLLAGVVASFDPTQNAGASQDAIASITGAVRNSSRFSIATGICVGTPLTILTAGRTAKVESTGARFSTLIDRTITALTAWVAATPYVVGQRVANANRSYQCITAGTSGGSGGPTTADSDITDGGVHWTYLGEGTGAVDAVFQAQAAGPIGALARTLDEIDTPVDGWKAVVNLADALVGANRETDSAFRVRRAQELAAAGNATVDAIRANILGLNQGSSDPSHQPPVACTVFFNDTDVTDADGLPPHSVEVLVQGGTTADIALEIWRSVGAGTRTYGQRSDVVTDSEGNPQTVYWTRPTEVQIYVTAVGRYDASKWTAPSPDALVANSMLSALLTYGEGYEIATDVRTSPLNGAMMRGPAQTDSDGDPVVPAEAGAPPVPGLLEVESIFIGTATGPTGSAQISITRRQIATFDSSRCVVTATSEDP